MEYNHTTLANDATRICETYNPRNTVQKSPPTLLKNKQLFLDMFVVSESKQTMCFNCSVT